MATHTSPADWWHEDEATLMTAVAVLEQMARASSGKGSSKGKRQAEGEDDGGA